MQVMADVVKYGIQIPNRVFVGGVAFDTKEDELKDFFTQYGKVKECKIIKDNQSISRGFAFVTFECKHDAVQTQQLGTVFFNQKKLNLGPAIRQKGIVFNGSKEADNEPVLSSGVYIHPSGYSYTVAPNGVWYFHNADGTPPTSMPGSPPIRYTSNVNTQKPSRRVRRGSTSDLSSGTSDSNSPPTVGNSPPTVVATQSLPTFHDVPPADLLQSGTTQVIHNCYQQPTGYIQQTHSTSTNSNIHVAFQNMSISSHYHGVPANHITIPGPPSNIVPSYGNHYSNTLNPAGQGQAITYSQVTEVPFYTANPGKISSISYNGISGTTLPPQAISGHCQYAVPVQKAECCSMLPPVARPNGQIVYPVVGEVYAHQMISPQEVKDEITPGYYRGIAPKPPQNVKN